MNKKIKKLNSQQWINELSAFRILIIVPTKAMVAVPT